MGPEQLVGSDVYDTEGERVGRVATVYLGEESQRPEWVTVQTGLFGHKETFVPLAGAQDAPDGLHVGWTKTKIKDAPRIDADGRLSARESMDLYRYYDMPMQRGAMDTERTDRRDQAMTRSEEQLRVGTERKEDGRVRLRKHVVTEEQQVTVPVTHEEVRVEREPVDPRQAGRTEIGDQEQEVILHREEPVVSKESVPVERVGLHTEEVTEQEEIRDKVRKERIDVENDRDARRRGDR